MYYLPRLKELREQQELGQKEIANILQIKQQQYSRYETGEYPIRVYDLVTLAKFYNVTTDYILGLSDKK